jgi:hypothetical protein
MLTGTAGGNPNHNPIPIFYEVAGNFIATADLLAVQN